MTIGRRKSLAGFTLIELLIVVAIITLLISILAPIGQEAMRKADRLKCAANMKNIVTGCMTYSSDHRGRWPNAFTDESTQADMLPDEPDEGGGLRGRDTEDHHGTDNEDETVNSNPASLWILIAEKIVIPEVFICPSTPDEPDFIRNADEVRDFLSRQNCSYSYQCRLGKRRIAGNPRLAVLADRSPFFDPYHESDDPEANSFNHDQRGQNVAFGDTRVVWFPKAYYEATGDWFYVPWTAPDDETPGDIPEGDTEPQSNDDAVLM